MNLFIYFSVFLVKTLLFSIYLYHCIWTKPFFFIKPFYFHFLFSHPFFFNISSESISLHFKVCFWSIRFYSTFIPLFLFCSCFLASAPSPIFRVKLFPLKSHFFQHFYFKVSIFHNSCSFSSSFSDIVPVLSAPAPFAPGAAFCSVFHTFLQRIPLISLRLTFNLVSLKNPLIFLNLFPVLPTTVSLFVSLHFLSHTSSTQSFLRVSSHLQFVVFEA